MIHEYGCRHQKAWKKVTEGDTTNDETAQNDEEESVTNVTNSVHYLDYEKTYYNQSKILFPLKQCPHQKRISDEKVSGTFELPPVIAPEFDESRKCPHGNIFDENNMKVARNWGQNISAKSFLLKVATYLQLHSAS